ncbi:MAG: HAD family hydrolase, partial [Thaumarchaeota archaeon]|nr:HAD family hydrolase [Nitrososphaerota archaeon]
AKVSYEVQPIFQTLQRIIGERPELREPLFQKIDEFELQAAAKAELHEGSAGVLKLLGESCDLSLVTMQGKKVTEHLFESLRLKDYFSSSFTRDVSLDRAKQLELALAGMQLGRKDVVFVGDRINDLNAARKVGVRFVLVRGRMDDVDPQVSYPSMNALLAALRSDGPVRVLG